MEEYELYEVQEGDTLQSISNHYGVSILSLKTLNNLELTDELIPFLVLNCFLLFIYNIEFRN